MPEQEANFTSARDAPILFSRIARWYDAMNRLMSLGRDRQWRRLAADSVALGDGDGRVLDVGVGTGDMALALLDRWPGITVVGLDPTMEMMQVGRGKPHTKQVLWAQGFGGRLPFPDEHFDAAVSAFVLRNIPNVPQALAEQYRVVKQGGRVISLEMTWPRHPILRKLFQLYFADLMPRVTGILSGQPAAYRYLPRSVQRFLTPEELKHEMERVGLRNVAYHKLALGTVYLHAGERK